MTASNRSFAGFWQWVWPHYRKGCIRTLLGVPIVALAAILLRDTLVCKGVWQGDSAAACTALQNPWSAVQELAGVWVLVLFVVVLMLAQALLLEWLKYRKDEPSAFTHGGVEDRGASGLCAQTQGSGF